jgi:hypothetical protein
MENTMITVKPTLLSTLSKEDYTQMNAGSIDNMLQVRVVASFLAGSKLLPASLKGDQNTAIALVLMAKQMNLPITALSEVCEVNGKISFWGRTKAGILFRDARCEYVIPVQKTEQACTLKAKRKGWPEAVEVTYTIEQARKAGLTGKDSWKGYPADMLYYRALSRVINEVFPDVIQGIATAEDIQDGVVEAEMAESENAPLAAPQEKKELADGAKAPRHRRTKAEMEEAKAKEEIALENPTGVTESVHTAAEAVQPEVIITENGDKINAATGEVEEEIPQMPEPEDSEPAVPTEEIKKTLWRTIRMITLLPSGADGQPTRMLKCVSEGTGKEEKYKISSLELAMRLKKLTGQLAKIIVYKETVVGIIDDNI